VCVGVVCAPTLCLSSVSVMLDRQLSILLVLVVWCGVQIGFGRVLFGFLRSCCRVVVVDDDDGMVRFGETSRFFW
jgi:hypothetical protein